MNHKTQTFSQIFHLFLLRFALFVCFFPPEHVIPPYFVVVVAGAGGDPLISPAVMTLALSIVAGVFGAERRGAERGEVGPRGRLAARCLSW